MISDLDLDLDLELDLDLNLGPSLNIYQSRHIFDSILTTDSRSDPPSAFAFVL